MNNSANWRVIDPDPARNLQDVHPVSVRARALLVRRLDHPAIRDDFLRVMGAIDMLGALDYHHSNLAKIEAALTDYFAELEGMRTGMAARGKTPEEATSIEHGRYEAIAYVVTLGRFNYFARAVLSNLKIVPTPTIDRLLVFRHKAAAHRSIDMPRGESPELQTLHALSLASAGGQLFAPSRDGRLALQYQIQRVPGEIENFVPSEDHGSVMNEAYEVLVSLLS